MIAITGGVRSIALALLKIKYSRTSLKDTPGFWLKKVSLSRGSVLKIQGTITHYPRDQ